MFSINGKDFIETVEMQGLQVSLLASGDSTEVIYHKLQPGKSWALEPEEGWEALEYIIIISGELKLQEPNGLKTLKPGESFYRSPIKEHYIFESIGTTEFLYVTSEPIFHRYSKVAKEMEELAVSIEEKDGYTADHCWRITRMSMLVGKAMGLNSKQMLKLNRAAFLHDIGKVKVPLEILQKPGKLTEAEWEIMKQHPTYGREILEETRIPTLVDSGKVVEQHHERYDGKGYPNNLARDEIEIEAAIITVVDSFDAMTTDRVYQKARSKEEAFAEILRCRGTMYNPDVVDIFIDLKEKIEKEEF